MKRAFLAMLALFALTVPMSEAGVADPVCAGAIGAVTVYGNLSVGPGCNLSNATVYGNVSVQPGGGLVIAAGSTTSIYGNVTSVEATMIDIEAGTIGGNVSVTGTTGASNIGNGSVNGNIHIQTSSGQVQVSRELVGGSVRLDNNSGCTNFVCFIGVVLSAVQGTIDVYGNTIMSPGTNVVSVAGNSSIGGNLQVFDNLARDAQFENAIFTNHNHVGGIAHVHHNTATGGFTNVVSVLDNTIGGSLGCEANMPTPTGGFNAAAIKTGECAAL